MMPRDLELYQQILRPQRKVVSRCVGSGGAVSKVMGAIENPLSIFGMLVVRKIAMVISENQLHKNKKI